MLIDKVKILHAGSDPKTNIDYYGMICFRNGKALSCDGKNTVIVNTGLDPLLHVCVNAEKLFRICKSFKVDPDSVTLDGTELVLRFGRGEFRLPTAEGDTFPDLDKFQIENVYHSGKGIVSAIRRALFCAEPDVERNPLCGVNLSPLWGVMSSNGKEVIRIVLEERVKSTFRIDYTAAKLVAKQKQDPKSMFTLGNTLGFVFEDFILMTRALHGDFPERLLTQAISYPETTIAFPASMESVMRVFNSVSTDKEFYVTLYFDKTGKRASLDGDIPASMVLDTVSSATVVDSASLRGDRLMLASKVLSPNSLAIREKFVQLVSEDSVYSIGRVT
jgi:DNA polymerase III sliding clamp (beta) subunit (PCNA family)